jgi:hypothetical protein
MSTKIKFTDVSSFDFKLDQSIAGKVKEQKDKIVTFMKSVQCDEEQCCLSDPIISATIHNDKVLFTLFQECPDK